MPRQFKPAIPTEIYLIRGQKVMLAEHSASTPTNPAIRVIDIPESYVRRFASGRVMPGKGLSGYTRERSCRMAASRLQALDLAIH